MNQFKIINRIRLLYQLFKIWILTNKVMIALILAWIKTKVKLLCKKENLVEVVGQVVVGQVVVGQVVEVQAVVGQVLVGQVLVGQVLLGQVAKALQHHPPPRLQELLLIDM